MVGVNAESAGEVNALSVGELKRLMDRSRLYPGDEAYCIEGEFPNCSKASNCRLRSWEAWFCISWSTNACALYYDCFCSV